MEAGQPRKWRIPDRTRLGPGGYLLVWADEDGTAPMGLHANFKLADSGEQVLLFDTDAHRNRLLDGIEYNLQSPDRSFGRRSNEPDNWGVLLPTPGGDND